MFDIFPKILSSIASFLFPLFASYKALKTSDPAQLTPWLMYWSVLSCALLVESWFEFILVWVPFYAYARLLFLLYLVLPQTQGARHLYETYLHPYLEDNEAQIEDFIASAHDRLKAAGMAYLKQAIEMLKTKVLGMPPTREDEVASDIRAKEAPQTYTQSLLARFSVPSAKWGGVGTSAASSTGQDFYNMLAGAVSAATGVNALGAAGAGAYGGSGSREAGAANSGNLIPDNIRGAGEKMNFIANQREKLSFLLAALDKEANHLEKSEQEKQPGEQRLPSMSLDGSEAQSSGTAATSRPPSGQSMWSALSKSRSEVDFEKIEAESGAEEDLDEELRQRRPHTDRSASSKGWGSFLGWGAAGQETPTSSHPQTPADEFSK